MEVCIILISVAVGLGLMVLILTVYSITLTYVYRGTKELVRMLGTSNSSECSPVNVQLLFMCVYYECCELFTYCNSVHLPNNNNNNKQTNIIAIFQHTNLIGNCLHTDEYFTDNSFCCTELKIQCENLRRAQVQVNEKEGMKDGEEEGTPTGHGGHIQSHTHQINQPPWTPYSSSLHQLQSSVLVPDCEIENDSLTIDWYAEVTVLGDDNLSHDMSHDMSLEHYQPLTSQTQDPEENYTTIGQQSHGDGQRSHESGRESHDNNNFPWATVPQQTKMGRIVPL